MFKKYQMVMHIIKENPESVNAEMDDKGWIHVSVIAENTDISTEDIEKIYQKNKDKIQLSEDKKLIRAYYKSQYK